MHGLQKVLIRYENAIAKDAAGNNNSCHQGEDIGYKLSSLRWNFEGAELPLDHDSQFLD